VAVGGGELRCPGEVDGAEASVDVVVDYADVLHKGVDARRPDEAETLRFQLLGERLGAGSRRWQVGDGRRFFPAAARVVAAPWQMVASADSS
jgi:hypothetical protein